MTPKAASGGTQRKTHFYLGDDFYGLNPPAGTPILRGLACQNDSLSLETGNAQFCLWIRPPRVTAGHFVFVRDRNNLGCSGRRPKPGRALYQFFDPRIAKPSRMRGRGERDCFLPFPKKRLYEGGYLDEISSLTRRRRARDEDTVLDSRGGRRFRDGLYTRLGQMRPDQLRRVVPIPNAAVSCVVAFHYG